MTTSPHLSTFSEQELNPLIKSEVFGQDATVHAVAAEFVRRHASHAAKQSIGVFLLGGAQL